MPYSLGKYLIKKIKWIYKYKIKKLPYSTEDQEEMTINALQLTIKRWEVTFFIYRLSLTMKRRI